VLQVDPEEARRLAELLNYGESALHYSGLVKDLKDQIIEGLQKMVSEAK